MKTVLKHLSVIIILLSFLSLNNCNKSAKKGKCQETSYKKGTIGKFGSNGSLVFLYYKDLKQASQFYENIIGLNMVLDVDFCKIYQLSASSFVGLIDEEGRKLNTSMPKTVTLAFVTNEVDEWYSYLIQQKVEIIDSLGDATRHPTRGFVALDPEGYYLEFETFLDHEQNKTIREQIENTKTLYPYPGQNTLRPDNLGVQTNITWLYYKDVPAAQQCYGDLLGFDLVLDQGFTKVYRVGPASYFGLVDEKLGLHSYSKEKSVALSLISENIYEWYNFVKTQDVEILNHLSYTIKNISSFTFIDPGDYYMVFNWFAENETLSE